MFTTVLSRMPSKEEALFLDLDSGLTMEISNNPDELNLPKNMP